MNEQLILFSLGSNLGNRVEMINKAINALKSALHSAPIVSSLYESQAWGFTTENLFLNCCIGIKSTLPAHRILTLVKEIENKLGRKMKTKNGEYTSRIIDIDILYYGNCILSSETLTIPHPLLYRRNFVLFPLSEIYPDFMDPQKNETIYSIKEKSTDIQNPTVYHLDK